MVATALAALVIVLLTVGVPAVASLAVDSALRERAARLRPAPVSIETARAVPAATEPAAPSVPSKWAGMGVIDDAEIEAHVRQLLERRSG